MDLTEAAALLDKIAEEQCHPFKIASEFRKRAAIPADAVVRTAAAALQYDLTESGESRRETYGPFAPMLQTEDFVTPPYTWDVQDDVLNAWQQLAELVHSPVVAARLQDLLWVTSFGEAPHEHARAAINNYISASALPHCDGLEAFDCLDRAFDLSRQLNVPGVGERIRQRAVEELVAEYNRLEADARPGVVIRLLTLLVSLPAADQPDDLRGLLDQAHVLFAGNYPDNRIALFQLQQRLARGDQAEIERLQRESVELWIQWAAQQESGWLRLDALGKALEIANSTRTTADMREPIRLMMQQTDPSDLYTESAEVSFELPADEVERLIALIVGDDSVGRALDRLGAWWPPTGDLQETSAAVDEQMEKLVFWRLIPQVITDPTGHPLRVVDTDEAKRALAMVQHGAFAARVHAVITRRALLAIQEAYAPGQRELHEAFQTALINSQQAEVFARTLQHYWAGRFDEAIHIALPRIEAVLRQALLMAGGIARKQPHGGRSGGVKALGEVLQALSRWMPEEMRFPFRVLLTDDRGLNLRNRYMHGLPPQDESQQATEQDASLVIHIITHLRLLSLQPSTEPPADDD